MLGKTRQSANETSTVEESFDEKLGPPRGVLRLDQPTAGIFRHARRSASAELAPWVDHYWMVYWDLRGAEPREVGTLPHPNVHVVFEREGSKAWGVSTAKFTRKLEGASHSFGIKFKPGGFFPFLKAPVVGIADCAIPVVDVFGREASALEETILSTQDEDTMMRAANDFLLRRMPEPDAKTGLAGELVERILREKDILTVNDLAGRSKMTLRSLQRLFSQYVGVSPKWVIRRYRLHELLERMHSGESLNFAALAIELGYFDQAHLIRDFKAIVGYAPTSYPGLKQKAGY